MTNLLLLSTLIRLPPPSNTSKCLNHYYINIKTTELKYFKKLYSHSKQTNIATSNQMKKKKNYMNEGRKRYVFCVQCLMKMIFFLLLCMQPKLFINSFFYQFTVVETYGRIYYENVFCDVI